MTRTRGIVAAVILVTASLVAWFPLASVRGRLAARYDMATGRYVVMGYGLPSASHSDFVRLLRERHGIQYRSVGGCTISAHVRAYSDGYNAASLPAIERKFGRDVLRTIAGQAEAAYKRRQPPPPLL